MAKTAFSDRSPTFQALAATVASAVGVTDPRLPTDPVRWAEFATLAHCHRVGPLVHRSGLLRQLGAPPEVTEDIASQSRHVALRALRQLQLVDALLAALHAADIHPIIYKGLPLAAVTHGDIAARHSNDIDVLVDPARVADTVRACAGLGLTLSRAIYGDTDALAEALADVTAIPAMNEVALTGGGIAIDLHWRLFANSRLAAGSLGSPRNPNIVHIGATAIPTLPDHQLLRYLAIHGTKHSWRRLKWLADIPPLVARSPVRQEAASNHDGTTERHLATAVRVAERVLGPFLTADDRSWAASVPFTGHLERVSVRTLMTTSPRVMPAHLTPRNLAAHVAGQMMLSGAAGYRREEARTMLLRAGRLTAVPNPGWSRLLRAPASWAFRCLNRYAGTLRRRARRVPIVLEAIAETTRASVVLALVSQSGVLRLLGTPAPTLPGRPFMRPGRPATPGTVPPQRPDPGSQVETARAVASAVRRAARLVPWHPTCLRQALAASRMLRRRGVPAQIHLGAAFDPPADGAGAASDPPDRARRGLAAHAWVTVDGTVVLGNRGRDRFASLASFQPRCDNHDPVVRR